MYGQKVDSVRCSTDALITVSPEVYSNMSLEEMEDIVTHNEYLEKLCGW